MVILDVSEDRVPGLVADLDRSDLPVEGSTWRRGTMACTGIEFCKLAIVETKGRAEELFRYLERRLPGYEEDIRINVNGCPNSCARFQTADIGLMGCQIPQRIWVTDTHGEQVQEVRKVEGFLVHLGGHLGNDLAFGRKVKGVKVPASEIGPYVETLIRRYRRQRDEGENFARFIARLTDPELVAFGAKPEFPTAPPAPLASLEPRV
jgi:sulfite reductase (ferredoxin)